MDRRSSRSGDRAAERQPAGAYAPPVLVEYGRLEDLTRGTSGTELDNFTGTVTFALPPGARRPRPGGAPAAAGRPMPSQMPVGESPECSARPACVPMRLDPGALDRYRSSLDVSSPGEAVGALASAIACGAAWSSLPEAALAVRTAGVPAVGVVGRFMAADVARVAAQVRRVEASLGAFSFIGFARVEVAIRELAEMVVRELGADGVREAAFIAIPRGGHVVLGLLAVALGLEAGQLSASADPRRLVVLVDDCALSGVRLRQHLAQLTAERVLVATLASPRPLRTAVARAERRVRGFVSAIDLEVLDSSAGARVRGDRAGSGREQGYWRGHVAPFALPWIEPDGGVAIAGGACYDSAWPLCPPSRCSRNRPGPYSPRIEAIGAAGGPLTPSPAALFAACGGDVAIASTDTGEMFALTGTAAEVWRSVIATGSPLRAVRSIARRAGVPRGRVRTDVDGLLAQLQARTLLVGEAAGG